MHYDRFRALYKLPVVPRGVIVWNTDDGDRFLHLVFRESLANKKNIVGDSLLRMRGGTVQRIPKRKPVLGKYYLPSDEVHPWFDRAVVAHRKDDESSTCLVLYRDSINATEVQSAVANLNAAAAKFKSDFSQILCVACIVGAMEETNTAPLNFKFPYVLVRDEKVSTFFTPTFAQGIHNLRNRHLATTQ